MIFNRYGDPRTMMRKTRDEVSPLVILEMSSNSVTPKASRRPRVTASVFSCGIMKSSLGKTPVSSIAKPPHRHRPESAISPRFIACVPEAGTGGGILQEYIQFAERDESI